MQDGTLVADDADYRLAPDGTGEVELLSINLATGEGVPTASRYGICWSVNEVGELVFDRVNSRHAVVTGSSRPDASVCASLTAETVSFRREQTLYEVNGVNIRTVLRQSDNSCGYQPQGGA